MPGTFLKKPFSTAAPHPGNPSDRPKNRTSVLRTKRTLFWNIHRTKLKNWLNLIFQSKLSVWSLFLANPLCSSRTNRTKPQNRTRVSLYKLIQHHRFNLSHSSSSCFSSDWISWEQTQTGFLRSNCWPRSTTTRQFSGPLYWSNCWTGPTTTQQFSGSEFCSDDQIQVKQSEFDSLKIIQHHNLRWFQIVIVIRSGWTGSRTSSVWPHQFVNK